MHAIDQRKRLNYSNILHKWTVTSEASLYKLYSQQNAGRLAEQNNCDLFDGGVSQFSRWRATLLE